MLISAPSPCTGENDPMGSSIEKWQCVFCTRHSFRTHFVIFFKAEPIGSFSPVQGVHAHVILRRLATVNLTQIDQNDSMYPGFSYDIWLKFDDMTYHAHPTPRLYPTWNSGKLSLLSSFALVWPRIPIVHRNYSLSRKFVRGTFFSRKLFITDCNEFCSNWN